MRGDPRLRSSAEVTGRPALSELLFPAQAETILETAPDAILLADSEGRIVLVNRQLEQLFGCRRSELLGKLVDVLVPPFREHCWAQCQAQLWGCRMRCRLELWCCRSDGSRFPADISSGPTEFRQEALIMTIVRDLTERKRLEERLRKQALYDSLTGLPNRNLLVDRLQHAILVARREAKPLAVLMIDLDRFKDVNDSLGHHCGDLVLRQVGVRLRGALRRADTVARLGGDEFAVLLTGRRDDAVRAAGRILRALRKPIPVHRQLVEIAASVGIAVWSEDGHDGDTLMQAADAAMYGAKHAGGAGYAVFEPDGHRPQSPLI